MSQDYLEQLSTEDLKKLRDDNLEGMSSRGLKLLRDNDYSPEQDYSTKRTVTGVVGSAAAAAGAYQVGRFFTAPGRSVKPIDRELANIQKRTGLVGTDPTDLPSLIKDKATEQTVSNRLAREQFTSKANQVQRKLGKQLEQFDNTVLNQSIDDVANSIQSNFSEFTGKAYQAYGEGLSSIEQQLARKNISFSSEQFIDEVINPAINSAKASGTTPQQLAKLEGYKSNFVGKPNQPMSYSAIKGNMSELAKELPPNGQYKLTESWGKFLEKNAPQEVKSSIESLNTQYKPFAQARQAISKTFDRRTGTFDRTKLNKWVSDYVKKNADKSKGELLKFLKEGNELVKPIKNLNKDLKNLSKSTASRKPLLKAVNKVKSVKTDKILKLRAELDRSRQEYLKWSNKSKQLISRRNAIKSKYGIRGNLVKSAGKAAMIASRGMRIMSLYPLASSVIKGIADPAKFRAGMLGTNIPIPDKGTKDRAVLEELINKKPLPKDMDITPEEKFNIFVKYGLGT